MKKLINAFIVVFVMAMSSLNAHAASEHASFDAILKENVSSEGFVDYSAIKQDARFLDYLDYLANAKPEDFATQDEKLAFWINAYNALTIKGILDGLSPNGFFKRITFFKSTKYDLAGRKITLNDLEHEIIIPFNEPRIHFAIVCASASCPKLIAEAYTADKLEQQLENNAIAFINNTDKNRFDVETKTASISKIFDWFKDDFIKASGSVQEYLARYVDDARAAGLLKEKALQVKHLNYDWSLNGKL